MFYPLVYILTLYILLMGYRGTFRRVSDSVCRVCDQLVQSYPFTPQKIGQYKSSDAAWWAAFKFLLLRPPHALKKLIKYVWLIF